MRKTIVALLLGSLALPGCAPYEKMDWSQYDGPGKEHFLAAEVEFPYVPDPIEPVNRVVSGFNHGLMTVVIQPISFLYRNLVPEFLRTAIGNAFDNAYFPVRFTSSLLQGKFEGAWRETKRFAVNTTYGIGGLWDHATDLGIEASAEDFGQTFGAWGWRDSWFFVLPFLGPSTIRDSIGDAFDAAADPATYFFPASQVRATHRLAQRYPSYERFVETNFSPYELGRTLFAITRELQIDDFEYRSSAERTGATETLGAVFLTYDDDDWPAKGTNHDVYFPHTGHDFSYTVWLQDDAAPITYVLPGTGGHRLSNSTLAIAEVVFAEGNSVVTLSSPLNFEFMATGSTVPTPGFVPEDAIDVHRALDAIDRNLRRRYPGRITSRSLVGLSLGASLALHIAANEEKSPALIDFEAFIALNSPVSFEHAVQQLDRFYNVPLRFDTDRMIETVLRKVLHIGRSGDFEPGDPLPFSAEEAQFIIGLAFRKTLGDIIVQVDQLHDSNIIVNRPTPLRQALTYREAHEFSFIEYIYAFVLPVLSQRRHDISYDEAGIRKLWELSDLRSIEAALRDNSKVRFFSNRNDFLLRPEDIRWVKETLGDRSFFFERGGHIGNLWREDVQQAITDRVEELSK